MVCLNPSGIANSVLVSLGHKQSSLIIWPVVETRETSLMILLSTLLRINLTLGFSFVKKTQKSFFVGMSIWHSV